MNNDVAPLKTTALCALMNGVGGGLGWSVIPPLLPRIAADLHISHALGGLVWGATPLGIALASPLGGAAVDRLGPRRVAGLAMLAGALACAARALATGPWSLAVCMLAFGLHIGFVAPAIPKALAGHVAPSRLARANGAALLAYTLGTALTVLFARTTLAPLVGGWRALMVVSGGAMAIVAVLWMLLVRDRIAHARHASLGDVLRLGANRQLLYVAAMHFLLFGGYLALLGMLPRALTERGVSLTRVGLAVASWLMVAAFANLAGPWLSDRLRRRRPLLITGALVAAGGLGAFALVPQTSGAWLLSIAALGGGCVAPLLLSLPLELEGIGPAKAGGALGLLMLVGQLGGFLLPILVGFALSHGLAAAIGLLAAAHLLIVVPALGVREPGATRVA
jgi:MFS family permease